VDFNLTANALVWALIELLIEGEGRRQLLFA
jgi:hypothetical protein